MTIQISAATRLTALEKKTQFLDLQISGSPEVIQTLANMLAVIEWNCKVGHSATVGMSVDGDGADRFTIEGLSDADKKLGREMAEACSSYGDDILARINSGTASVLNTVYEGDVKSFKTTVVYPESKVDSSVTAASVPDLSTSLNLTLGSLKASLSNAKKMLRRG